MSPRSKTWLNLWTVYIIWGSTYFAIAYVVESMPPLLSMGVRFLLAGSLLFLLILLFQGRGELQIRRKEKWTASILGFLLLGFGLGNVALAQRYVPSGIVALIIAALPLWILIFRFIYGERPKAWSWLGVIIGFSGVALLLKPGSVESISGASTGKVVFFMVMVLIGNIGWAFGTYLAPKLEIPKNALVLTAYEMLAGGLSLTIAGLVAGETFTDLFNGSQRSWFWFGYLVLFGSIIAYSSYLWLVSHAPVSLTATYAYVNPIIAVTLGAIFLDEKITRNYALGGAIILIGVLVLLSTERIARAAESRN